LQIEPPTWSLDELRAADLGEVVAWVTPSVAARVDQELALSRVSPDHPLGDAESLVVVGGGTLIDRAKLAARTAERSIFLVAIPSIHGSGAEASPVAVIDRDGVKEIRVGRELLPDRRVVWAELVASVPPARARVACGDCWAHALEGFLSPLADHELRGDLAGVIREMTALPLGNDPRWLDLGARACAGQARSSVGLIHGIAHVVEGPLRATRPKSDWGHAKLCATFLWPVMRLNRKTDTWDRLSQEWELDSGAIDEVARGLWDRAAYAEALPVLVDNWNRVLRDRCTRTNSCLVRPSHLGHFEEMA
jgi:alcohol dehydrogenase class IV